MLSARRSDGEHEASRRVKTEFLVELDGAGGAGAEADGAGARVLFIGATICPWDLDDALMRRLAARARAAARRARAARAARELPEKGGAARAGAAPRAGAELDVALCAAPRATVRADVCAPPPRRRSRRSASPATPCAPRALMTCARGRDGRLPSPRSSSRPGACPRAALKQASSGTPRGLARR